MNETEPEKQVDDAKQQLAEEKEAVHDDAEQIGINIVRKAHALSEETHACVHEAFAKLIETESEAMHFLKHNHTQLARTVCSIEQSLNACEDFLAKYRATSMEEHLRSALESFERHIRAQSDLPQIAPAGLDAKHTNDETDRKG